MKISKHLLGPLSCVLACGAAWGCAAGSSETVGARFHPIGRAGSALTSATVTAINGTYGPTCLGHSAAGTDAWSIALSGSPAFQVIKNDASCVLTMTEIVTSDGVFVAATPIVLAAVAGEASAFALPSAAPLFYANATLSSTGFASDFEIALTLSDTVRVTEGGDVTAVFSPVPLRSLRNTAVLAGSTITNAGSSTVVDGELALSPGTSVTGLPVGQPSGALSLGLDPVAVQAQTDLGALLNVLDAKVCPLANTLSGIDLGGLTLSPGVYCYTGTAAFGGTLILDANDDPDAYWIFQVGSTLDIAAGSTLTVINGGTACNVFWRVGSSATILADVALGGTIAASASVTLGEGTSISPGRVLARNGGVTMDSNVVSSAACQGFP